MADDTTRVYRVLKRYRAISPGEPLWTEVGQLVRRDKRDASDFGESWGEGEYLYWTDDPRSFPRVLHRIVVVAEQQYRDVTP